MPLGLDDLTRVKVTVEKDSLLGRLMKPINRLRAVAVEAHESSFPYPLRADYRRLLAMLVRARGAKQIPDGLLDAWDLGSYYWGPRDDAVDDWPTWYFQGFLDYLRRLVEARGVEAGVHLLMEGNAFLIAQGYPPFKAVSFESLVGKLPQARCLGEALALAEEVEVLLGRFSLLAIRRCIQWYSGNRLITAGIGPTIRWPNSEYDRGANIAHRQPDDFDPLKHGFTQGGKDALLWVAYLGETTRWWSGVRRQFLGEGAHLPGLWQKLEEELHKAAQAWKALPAGRTPLYWAREVSETHPGNNLWNDTDEKRGERRLGCLLNMFDIRWGVVLRVRLVDLVREARLSGMCPLSVDNPYRSPTRTEVPYLGWNVTIAVTVTRPDKEPYTRYFSRDAWREGEIESLRISLRREVRREVVAEARRKDRDTSGIRVSAKVVGRREVITEPAFLEIDFFELMERVIQVRVDKLWAEELERAENDRRLTRAMVEKAMDQGFGRHRADKNCEVWVYDEPDPSWTVEGRIGEERYNELLADPNREVEILGILKEDPLLLKVRYRLGWKKRGIMTYARARALRENLGSTNVVINRGCGLWDRWLERADRQDRLFNQVVPTMVIDARMSKTAAVSLAAKRYGLGYGSPGEQFRRLEEIFMTDWLLNYIADRDIWRARYQAVFGLSDDEIERIEKEEFQKGTATPWTTFGELWRRRVLSAAPIDAAEAEWGEDCNTYVGEETAQAVRERRLP